MNIAKRLDFEPTGSLDIVVEARHAVDELHKAVDELSSTASQKQAQILALAKQSAEQGIGDNDLKRLKRQFDSNKATYVNIDQKQRFMQGLHGLDLDIQHLTAVKDQHEQHLEQASESLRALKAGNEQARTRLVSTAASINQLYSLVEQETKATNAQLAATTVLLQQHSSSRAPVDDTPIEPGPGQVETRTMLEAETAQAKELERSIAAAEAELSELEARSLSGCKELTALRAEIERLEALASNVAQAANADAHVKSAAQWCNDLLSMMTQLNGLSVISMDGGQLILGLTIKVPTDRQPGSTSVRQLHHELTLQLMPRSVAAHGVLLSAANLSPDVPHIKTFLEATVNGSDVSPTYVVSEVRRRLLSYWQRQVLIESAAEVFSPGSSSRGPPHIKAALPNQVEVEVLVPWTWPSGPQPLQLVTVTSSELSEAQTAQLMDLTNGNSQLMMTCDLLQLLQHVTKEVEHLLTQ